MKVIQWIDKFYPSIGGGSMNIRSWIRGFPDIEFEVVTNGYYNRPKEERYSDNAVIRRFGPLDVATHPWYTGKKKYLFFCYRLPADMLRFTGKKSYLRKTESEFDLIQVSGPVTNYNFVQADRYFRRSIFQKLTDFSFTKKPKLMTICGWPSDMTKNPADKMNEERMLRHFDNILCLSKRDFDFIMKFYRKEGLEKKKNVWWTTIVAETELFSWRPLPNKEKLGICFVARLEENRGVNLLIDLINNLPDFAELTVLGAGEEAAVNKFLSQIDPKNIRFFPNTPREDVPKFLHECDLLFNPQIPIGSGLAAIEAMSCGRPVIMTKHEYRYPVIDGETGFLIDDNIVALLELLGYLNEHREVIKERGERSRKLIEDFYSDKAVFSRVREVYEYLSRR